MLIETNSPFFTRPADTTAYTIGDLVANSVTAGSVVPIAFDIPESKNFNLTEVGLKRSSAVTTNAKFTLHLYKDSPTCANGDNGAWSTTESKWVGSVAIDGTTQTFTDHSKAIATINPPIPISVDQDSLLYGLLVANAAYTPTSAEVFTLTLRGSY